MNNYKSKSKLPFVTVEMLLMVVLFLICNPLIQTQLAPQKRVLHNEKNNI